MSKRLSGFWLMLLSCAASAVAQSTVTTAGTTTAGTIPVFGPSSTTTVTNSPITVSNGNVGIGTTNPGELLEIGNSGNLRVTGGNFGINVDSGGAWNYNNWLYRLGWNSTLGDWAYFAPSGNHPAANDAAMILDSNRDVLFGTGKTTADGLTAEWMRISNGNVGIGTTSPSYPLDVVGAIHSSGAIIASGGVTFPDGTSQTSAFNPTLCGGDYAESVNAARDRKRYEPGDVLEIAETDSQDVVISSEPYSTLVAGVYSTKPGVIGRRQKLPKSSEEIPMAMVGIVPTKVTAENGPIHKGDLLVSSSTPGSAMKGTDRSRMLGAVIGKAMGSLDRGDGVIEVLVTLQ